MSATRKSRVKGSRRGFAVHTVEAVVALLLVITFIIFVVPGFLGGDTTEEIIRNSLAASTKAIDANGTLRAPLLEMNFPALTLSLAPLVPRGLQFTVGACTTNGTTLSWGTAGNASHYLRTSPNSVVLSVSFDLQGSQFLGSFPSDLALDVGNDTSSEWNTTVILSGQLKVGSALLAAAVDSANKWLGRNPGCDAYINFSVSNQSDGLCEVPMRWFSASAGEAALSQAYCVSAARAPENVSIIALGYMIPGLNATFNPAEFLVSAWRS